MGSPLVIQPIPITMKAWEWVALATLMSQLPHGTSVAERFQDEVQESIQSWTL